MTLLFYDGFDGLEGQEVDISNPLDARYYWEYYGTVTSSISPPPPYGGNVLTMNEFFCFGCDPEELSLVSVEPAPHKSGVIGFRLLADINNRYSMPLNKQALLQIWNNVYSTPMISLGYTKSYQLSLYTGSFSYTSPVKISEFKLRAQTWHYVEIGYTVAPVSGSITVRVDGEEILSINDYDFPGILNPVYPFGYYVGSDYVGRIEFLGHPRMAIDDVYILDTVGPAPYNTFLGDVKVFALTPSASGDLTQWTASSGANWTAVDDSRLSGSIDYIYTSASAATDLYRFTNLPITASKIYSVKSTFGYLSGSQFQNPKPSVRSPVVPVLSISGSLYYRENYQPTPRVLGSTYYESRNKYYNKTNTIFQEYQGMYTVNPATLSEWTMGDIASLQAGLTIISPGKPTFQSYIIY